MSPVRDPARPLWILCVLFGVGVIAFAVWFAGVIPTQTCTGLPAGSRSSLLVYQMSRTPADIEVVFGGESDPCRDGMVEAMDRANRVDLSGFIATYGAFLGFFFLALSRAGAGAIARIGLAAVVSTLAFDALETATQIYITGVLPGTAVSLELLAIGSTGKFLGLALVSGCAGAAMLRRGGIPSRLAGIACLAGGLMVVVGLAWAPALPALSAGNAIAWLVSLLYATAAAVRGTPAAATA